MSLILYPTKSVLLDYRECDTQFPAFVGLSAQGTTEEYSRP